MTLQDNILPAIAGMAILFLVARSIWKYEAEYYDSLKKSARGPVRPSERNSGITPGTGQSGSPDPDPEPDETDIPTQDDIVLLDDDEKETLERARFIRTKIDARIAALQSAGLEITNLDKWK